MADVFVLGAADFSLACRFFAGHNCQTDVLVQESADYFFCLPALFCECIRQASVHLIIYTGENELSSLGPSFPHTLSALTRPLSTLTRPFLLSYYPSSALTNPLAFALHHYPLAFSSLFLLPCGHHITIYSPLLSLSFTAFRCVSSLCFFGQLTMVCSTSRSSFFTAFRSISSLCFSPTTSLCLLSLSASLSYQPTLSLLWLSQPLSAPSQPPLSSFRPFFLSLFLNAYMASYASPSSPSSLPSPAVIMALRIWASEFRNR